MITSNDDELGARLRAIEAGEWVPDQRRRVRRGAISVGLASAVVGLALGLGAGYTTAASVVTRSDIQQAEGAFNKGQPLYCSHLEDLPLPAAAQWLSDRGYTATWQWEQFPGGPQVKDVPPEEGVIVSGGMVDARTIAFVVAPQGSPLKRVSECP